MACKSGRFRKRFGYFLGLDIIRHTFAVHVLQKWVIGGNDLTAMLPMLSTYMGHIC